MGPRLATSGRYQHRVSEPPRHRRQAVFDAVAVCSEATEFPRIDRSSLPKSLRSSARSNIPAGSSDDGERPAALEGAARVSGSVPRLHDHAVGTFPYRRC